MEYYSAKKEQTTDTGNKPWMNLKNIMLSDRSQTQNTYCDSIYMEFLEKAKFYRKKADQWCWGGGAWRLSKKGTRELLGVMQVF